MHSCYTTVNLFLVIFYTTPRKTIFMIRILVLNKDGLIDIEHELIARLY